MSVCVVIPENPSESVYRNKADRMEDFNNLRADFPGQEKTSKPQARKPPDTSMCAKRNVAAATNIDKKQHYSYASRNRTPPFFRLTN